MELIYLGVSTVLTPDHSRPGAPSWALVPFLQASERNRFTCWLTDTQLIELLNDTDASQTFATRSSSVTGF